MTYNRTAREVRSLILSGELAPGEPVVEEGLAKRLNISRTPIRNVLPVLAREGLLEARGRRGYSVKIFNEKETLAALGLRGILEGAAARMVAEKEPDAKFIFELEECVREGDGLFNKRSPGKLNFERYQAMNLRFHNMIIKAANFPLLENMIEQVCTIPFAAPTPLVFEKINIEEAFDILFVAHSHHHAIVEAIKMREGARAEAMFREHANQQRRAMFSWGATA